jgi:hypothetical protein
MHFSKIKAYFEEQVKSDVVSDDRLLKSSLSLYQAVEGAEPAGVVVLAGVRDC